MYYENTYYIQNSRRTCTIFTYIFSFTFFIYPTHSFTAINCFRKYPLSFLALDIHSYNIYVAHSLKNKSISLFSIPNTMYQSRVRGWYPKGSKSIQKRVITKYRNYLVRGKTMRLFSLY